jgi:hypothetical protein
MRLLLRIAFVWIVLGFLTGLFLRTRKNQSLGWLLALGFVPWLLHQLYLLLTLEINLPLSQLTLFLGLSVGFTVIAALIAWFYIKRRSLVLAAIPFAHGFAYSLLLLWLSRITQTDGLGLNTVSWAVFASGILFMTSLLASYLPRFSSPKLPGFSLRRGKK